MSDILISYMEATNKRMSGEAAAVQAFHAGEKAKQVVALKHNVDVLKSKGKPVPENLTESIIKLNEAARSNFQAAQMLNEHTAHSVAMSKVEQAGEVVKELEEHKAAEKKHIDSPGKKEEEKLPQAEGKKNLVEAAKDKIMPKKAA